ncbi:hypothetical protein [Labrys neptuniae]
MADSIHCLVKDGGRVVLAIERKTTKLKLDAQYADNPMAVAHQNSRAGAADTGRKRTVSLGIERAIAAIMSDATNVVE